MKTYRSLKGGNSKVGKFIYRGQRLRTGDIVQSETEPTDGKGNSLVNSERPAFELISESGPRNPDARDVFPTGKKWDIDWIERANTDTRTKPEIAADIKKKHGQEIDHRPIRKADLLAQEYQLDLMRGKDAAMGTNDPMTLSQAQEFLK